jgi:hypothetical protein
MLGCFRKKKLLFISGLMELWMLSMIQAKCFFISWSNTCIQVMYYYLICSHSLCSRDPYALMVFISKWMYGRNVQYFIVLHGEYVTVLICCRIGRGRQWAKGRKAVFQILSALLYGGWWLSSFLRCPGFLASMTIVTCSYSHFPYSLSLFWFPILSRLFDSIYVLLVVTSKFFCM